MLVRDVSRFLLGRLRLSRSDDGEVDAFFDPMVSTLAFGFTSFDEGLGVHRIMLPLWPGAGMVHS